MFSKKCYYCPVILPLCIHMRTAEANKIIFILEGNNMKLAQGEHIVGQWDYAQTKSKKGFSRDKEMASLILTNKRIVHDVVSKHAISREEVQLKEVCAIDSFHSKKPNFWIWVKIIFGIILVPVILGIFILKNNIPRLGDGEFTLAITTSGVQNVAFAVGASKGVAEAGSSFIKSLILFIPNLVLGLVGIHLGGKKETVKKMKINHAVIREIIDVLGATVMDSKVSSVTVSDLATNG